MALEPKPTVDSTVATAQDGATTECNLEKGAQHGLDIAHGTFAPTTLLDILDRWQIAIAWIGLILVSFTNYLDAVTVSTYHVYALSEFKHLSIEGAMSTIFGVIALAIQGVLAALARELHSFNIICFSVICVTVAFILEAAAPGIAAFVTGHAFYIVGLMTSKFMIFVLSAELSTLRHRSLSLGAANMPAVISQLGGAKVAESALQTLGWRWGIGMWCILIPVASTPLLAILFISKRTARDTRELAHDGQGPRQRTLHIWRKLLEGDLVGCALLAAGCAMFFLPIPLEHGGVDKYASAHCVAPTVIGFVILIVFGVWEGKYAPKPLFPGRLIRNRNIYGPALTLLCGNFTISFVAPYFYVYLQVTSLLSISEATYITLALPLVNAFSQLVYGAIISWMKRPKWLFVATSGILLLGGGLQYAFIDPHTQLRGLVTSQIVAGLGFGGLLTAIVLAQAASTPEDVPALSAGYIIIANFSGSIAGAVVGGIWTTTLIRNLESHLPEAIKGQARVIMGSLVVAQSYEWGSPEREAINAAHRETFRPIFLGYLVAAALAFLFSFIVDDIDVSVVDEQREVEKHVTNEKDEPKA